jgi:hypothetical protein
MQKDAISLLITKATNTESEYLIFIAFHGLIFTLYVHNLSCNIITIIIIILLNIILHGYTDACDIPHIETGWDDGAC